MKKVILITVILPMFLSACTDMDEINKVEESGNPILIAPYNVSVTKAAIDGTTFPDARTMVLSAYYNAVRGTSTNYFDEVTFSKNGSTWSNATTPKYWPLSGTLDLFAYSVDGLTITSEAYETKVSDGVTIGIPDNSTIQTDIMHAASAAQVYNSAGTPMTFRHAQALLVFTAKSNVAYNSTTNMGITIEEIGVENAYFSGTLKMTAANDATNGYCTWTSLGSKKAAGTNAVGGVKLLNGSSTTLNYNVPSTAMDVSTDGNHMGIGGVGIMVPEQSQTQFCIKYTMHNGKDDNGDVINNTGLLYTYTCSGTWEEAKKYVYGISFTQNQITVTPSISDWTNTPVPVSIP